MYGGRYLNDLVDVICYRTAMVTTVKEVKLCLLGVSFYFSVICGTCLSFMHDIVYNAQVLACLLIEPAPLQ